jgi:hypothetical protein
VTLYYQTASKEYVTFLRDENIGNPEDWRHWGDSLYAAWDRRGKSRPVSMATITVQVIDSTTGVNSGDDPRPVTAALFQNYPNPFNPTTTIGYTLSASSAVTIAVYDLAGREVVTLVNGHRPSGDHSVVFDAADLPSGIYFYRLTVNRLHSQVRKLVLLR